MSEMTIAQQFLGKLLVDTEKIAITSEPYPDWKAMNTTAVLMLTTAFHALLEKSQVQPWYGIRGGLPEEALEAICNTEFSEDQQKQFSWNDDPQIAMEVVEAALQDPAFRALFDGLLLAFQQVTQMNELLRGAQQEEPQPDA